jgi:hypothetical protein
MLGSETQGKEHTKEPCLLGHGHQLRIKFLVVSSEALGLYYFETLLFKVP